MYNKRYMKSNSFRDMIVWEKSMVLAQRVYGVVKVFPIGRAIWLGESDEKSRAQRPF